MAVQSLPQENPDIADPGLIWSFEGNPPDFWRIFLSTCCATAGATAAWILVRPPNPGAAWSRLSPWPSAAEAQPLSRVDEELARACVDDGVAFRDVARNPSEAPLLSALALAIPTRDKRDCVGVFLFKDAGKDRMKTAADKLAPLAHAPAVYEERQERRSALQNSERAASLLDLLAMVGPQNRFLAMAMTLCNELASRLGCEKISIGWLENDGCIHLKAISHTEKFESKMDAVRQIESAMQETLDQDDELVWPPPAGVFTATRNHARMAQARGLNFLCSVPLREKERPVAVLLAERQSAPFTGPELASLRIACDLALPRLAELKRRDRWFGARWACATRERLVRWMGPEHTWAKAGVAAAVILLGILFFGRAEYRVEGAFTLKAEHAIEIPALFNGYIGGVGVRLGDRVAAGQELVSIDTRELRLEEASAAADHRRYVREAEKLRAENLVADSQISMALADQAKARLDLVRDRIARSSLRAPFDCIVVEGDLRERVGAPVSLGEPLFRLAQLDELYVLMDIDESQIHEIRPGMTGEIAFASQPQWKFPVEVVRVDPMARGKGQKNIFSIRCDPSNAPADWWRPGMSGIGKIDAGRRSLVWILMRRTTDFLRLHLWW